MANTPTVKIELAALRKLAQQAAEYYRLDMTYGAKIVKIKTPWYRRDKQEYVPFDTWQETWTMMVNYYPYNELCGLFKSEKIEGYFVPPTEVEISLRLAGRLGYAVGGGEDVI